MAKMRILKYELHSPSRGGYRANITEATIDENGKRRLLTVYEDPKNRNDYGAEYYQGKNYITDSTERSYSRNFKQFKGLPQKYKQTIELVKLYHTQSFGKSPTDLSKVPKRRLDRMQDLK